MLLNPYRFGITPEIPDPYFTNVQLLLHFNSDFTDSSSFNRSVAPFSSGVTISSSTYIFPPASAAFIGVDALLVNTTSFSTSDDFCFEGGLNFNAIGTVFIEIIKWATGSSSSDGIGVNPSGKLHLWKDSIGEVVTATTVFVIGNWYRWRINRSSGVIRLFINGNLEATTSNSSSYGATTNLLIGAGDYNTKFYGFMDEIRITKGQSREISNYTLATSPFPNS